MHPQKKRRELEKRRDKYQEKKELQSSASIIAATSKPWRISKALFSLADKLKHSRSKFSLWKRQFALSLRKRQTTFVREPDSYYKRDYPKANVFNIQSFLEKHAIDFPGQKGSSKQKKVLTKPMAVLLKEFKIQHPDVKLSLTTFKRRRPDHILLSSSRKFLQCLCEKCANTSLLIDAIRKTVDRFSIKGVDELVRETLCDKYKRTCIERECSNCGISDLMSSIHDCVGDLGRMVKWSQWERTEKMRKDLVIKESSVAELLKVFECSALAIAKHFKVAQWQRHHYQFLKDNLPLGHAMCTVDFAENYLCKFQNEVQSAHWSYNQVSLHPSVFFYRCGEPGCHKLITEYEVYLSDELKHSSSFTKHVIRDCIEKLKSKGMSAIHIFSDGSSSQYKSRYTFKDLADLQAENRNITVTRHFFGSNHGKSLCDSCGGVVKNAATRAVLSGSHIIQSAQDLLSFCSANLTVLGSEGCLHDSSLRSFTLVKPNEICPRNTAPCVQVKGIQAIHSLRFKADGNPLVRDISCFCYVCLLGEEGICPNEEFTSEWHDVDKDRFKKRKSSNRNLTFTINSDVDIDSFHNSGVLVTSDQSASLSLLESQADATLTLPADESASLSLPESQTDVTLILQADQSASLSESQADATQTLPASLNIIDSSLGDPPQVSLSMSASEIQTPNVPVSDTDSVPRHEYFASVQEKLCRCSTLMELKSLADSIISDFSRYELPIIGPKCIFDVGIVDGLAKKLLPNFVYPLHPVLTVPDGNCVPRSLSLLCFGDQDHHVEIRCRIAIELALNSFDYLCLSPEDLNLLHLLSDSYSSSVKETFESETLAICKPSVYMGIWQIMAAANIFQCNIFSLYPEMGMEKYRNFLTRNISPRISSSDHTLILFWTATQEHHEMMPPENWTANHVVPLMGLTESVEIAVS